MKPPAFDMHVDWSFETAGYQGQLCMYKRPGYKIKDFCEKQGASLLLALCIHATLCGYIISNIILLIYIFNV